MTTTAPKLEVISSNGEPTDAAISALARLLLAVVDGGETDDEGNRVVDSAAEKSINAKAARQRIYPATEGHINA